MTNKQILQKKNKALKGFARGLLKKKDNGGIGKIVLFGSVAWGDPSEDSDIDLFVFSKEPKKTDKIARDISADILLEEGEIIETIVKGVDDYYDPKTGLLMKAIREGREIYDNEKI